MLKLPIFQLFLHLIGRCNASDEWCGWISQGDAKTRWSVKMAADLTRAGEDIANDADYDVNEGKKAMLDGKLSVN